MGDAHRQQHGVLVKIRNLNLKLVAVNRRLQGEAGKQSSQSM